MQLEDIIRKHYSKLGDLDKEIIYYILNNKREVSNMSIVDLAKEVHASKSTVLRLTKKIGFSGYSEFRYYLKQINDTNNNELKNKNFISIQKNDINRTIDYLSNLKLEKALEKIHFAETIYCYGTGYSQRKVVEEFGKVMMFFEKKVIIIPNKTELDIAMPMIKDTDIFIIASLSGETEEIKENLLNIGIRKIPTISITAFGDNFISQNSDYNLFYYATPIIVGRKSFVATSLIGLSITMDYLFRAYGEYNRIKK